MTATQTKTFEEEADTFNGFTEGIVDLTVPMKLNATLQSKGLTLMTGTNDVGKSLYNKLFWCSTLFFNLLLIQNKYDTDEGMTEEELLQYILDKSFSSQNFCGTLQFNYKDPLMQVKFYGIDFTLKDGIVSDLRYELSKNTDPMGPIIYLSKDVRSISAITKYAKIKKMLGIKNLSTMKSIEPLTDMYKLYDILSTEHLLSKFEDINAILKQIKSTSSANDLLADFDIQKLEYDNNTGEVWYYNSENDKKMANSLGDGAQAILVMLMTSI